MSSMPRTQALVTVATSRCVESFRYNVSIGSEFLMEDIGRALEEEAALVSATVEQRHPPEVSPCAS